LRLNFCTCFSSSRILAYANLFSIFLSLSASISKSLRSSSFCAMMPLARFRSLCNSAFSFSKIVFCFASCSWKFVSRLGIPPFAIFNSSSNLSVSAMYTRFALRDIRSWFSIVFFDASISFSLKGFSKISLLSVGFAISQVIFRFSSSSLMVFFSSTIFIPSASTCSRSIVFSDTVFLLVSLEFSSIDCSDFICFTRCLFLSSANTIF